MTGREYREDRYDSRRQDALEPCRGSKVIRRGFESKHFSKAVRAAGCTSSTSVKPSPYEPPWVVSTMTHDNRSTRGIRDHLSHRHVSEARQSGDQDDGRADVSRTGQGVGRRTCALRRRLCGAEMMAVSVHGANLKDGVLQLSGSCRKTEGASSD